MNDRRRLRLIAPAEQLTGVTLPELERLARRVAAGDDTHRGLVFLSCTIARRALATAVPPGARVEFLAGLEVAESWARGQSHARDVRRVRGQCFSAVALVERQTVEAVERARAHLPPQRKTGLDPHADLVVERYAALAAHYAASATILTLDGVTEPARLAEVPQQVAGARAYQATGLGAARHGEFRAKAWDQATWEAERAALVHEHVAHEAAGLALQVFHEYLGATWKGFMDAESLALDEFTRWALSGAR